MLELGLTKDAPGASWCKIWEIEEELYEYEAAVFPKYKNCFPLSYGYVFVVFLKNMSGDQCEDFIRMTTHWG